AAKLESLRREADKRHIEIEILSGAELYLVPDLPARLAADPGLMLSGSRCALIECPMQGIPPYADGVLSSLMESGVTPILAHPERNAAVMEDASVLMPFLCKGVFLQINAGSILGYYEKRVLRTVRELLERDMVHFIGSDAHGPGERSPSLSAAVAEAATWIGAQKAGQLVASQLMWP
ncbi:MAG: CpsB/CapC family capsule biosynthesis tyrosine phosphatase, partial [bacterium]